MSQLQCLDIINLKTRRLTRIAKKEQVIKLNSTLTLLQLGFRTRKPKILKQLVYYTLLINSFNAKLRGSTNIIKGLDKADENEP